MLDRTSLRWEQCLETPKRTDTSVPTIGTLVEHYRLEKMPHRASTRRGYELYLRKHILPQCQYACLETLQARPVDLWLRSLSLARKARFTFGDCCILCGITRCGAETCLHNGIRWSWSRSRMRLNEYRNRER